MLGIIFWSFALSQCTLVIDVICPWQRKGLHGSPHVVIEVIRPSDSLNEASIQSVSFSLSSIQTLSSSYFPWNLGENILHTALQLTGFHFSSVGPIYYMANVVVKPFFVSAKCFDTRLCSQWREVCKDLYRQAMYTL